MKDNTELQQISETTGAEPRSCSYDICANMCRRSPCLGTPADILRIAEAGHADKLTPTLWAAGMFHGIAPIAMVQLSKRDNGECIFFQNGLCSIHNTGLKPTEGQLAYHGNNHNPTNTHLTLVVARTWTDDNNLPSVIKLCNLIIEQQKNNHD